MAKKIIGITRSQGEYQGVKFDKWIFYVIEEEKSERAFAGEVTGTFKVKNNQLRDVFRGLVTSENDLADLIGRRCVVMYDEYKNPQLIDLLDD